MKKKVLIIDDEQDILSITKLRLEAAGYEVLTADSAEAGLEVLKKQMPNLILLDLILPKMQGEELCQMLVKNHKTKHIPIILFTAKSYHGESNFGAVDRLIKPFESAELLSKIKKHLK